MWFCKKCQSRHEDDQEVCWNCGTSKEGIEDPNFVRADAAEEPAADSGVWDKGEEAHAEVTLDQLLFVGFNGYALALDRDTGEIVWTNNQMQSGYVSLMLDGDRLIVSTNGYMYCLDPLTGEILWHNPLTGYGVGPASVTSVRGQTAHAAALHAKEVERRRQQSSTH